MIHGLSMWCGVRGQECQFNRVKLFCMWMSRRIINDQGNLSVNSTKLLVQLAHLFFEKFHWRPTLALSTITARWISNAFGTYWFISISKWQTSGASHHTPYQQPILWDGYCCAFLLSTFLLSNAVFYLLNIGRKVRIRRHWICFVKDNRIVSVHGAVISSATDFDSPKMKVDKMHTFFSKM